MKTAMNRICIILLSVLCLASGHSVAGVTDYYEIETSFRNNGTENLFKNWSETGDSFQSIGFTLKEFSFPWREVRFTVEQTWYEQSSSLNNLMYQLGFTLTPLGENSRTTLFLTGNLVSRDYEDLSEEVSSRNEFSSKDYDALVSLSHQFSSNLQARTGLSFKVKGFQVDYEYDSLLPDYTTETVPATYEEDRYDYELFAGINYSLPWDASFDLEGGYRFGDYQHAIDTSERVRPVFSSNAYSSLVENSLSWFYISPRISKSIGSKTGVSLTCSRRSFVDGPNDSAYVYGNTTGFISPWASVYVGNGVHAKFKTFILPEFIISGGFGYFEKTFVTTMDKVDSTGHLEPIAKTYYIKDGRGEREDIMRRFSLTLIVPFSSHSGYYFEPSIKIDYTNNHSSIVVYDYSDLSVTTELKLRF